VAKLQKKSFDNREKIRAVLKQFWGFENFRPLQEEIILSVMEKKDTLALMPTGGGKSLTFQVPALAMEGICLVITPLIALMKDQVDQLTALGIRAAAIHSGMARAEISVTLDNCIFGGYKFLYVSPERLQTDLFLARIHDMPVSLLAVDEAHCISQWGYDFRPSYLEIRNLRHHLDNIPVLALTATATPEVCGDIQHQLNFGKPNLLKMDFDRKNLAYVVRYTENKEKELSGIFRRMDGCGIVYVRNRKKCRELAEMLADQGVSAGYYHAGLEAAERERRQQNWTGNAFRVMVATNAFGMGIDKADVRLVVHADMPDSPEAYFQEAGRAGRDGEKAWAVLLFSPSDKRTVLQRIAVQFPEIRKVRDVYVALCNYLQVPHGSGKGRSFDFDLSGFLQRYRLQARVAQSALSILSGEGYIALSDAMNNPSRVMFRAGRDELYNFQVRNAGFDSFIKLLLRVYSGLFSGYVRIDESRLSRLSGLPQAKVVEYLKNLSSRQVIHYIPRKHVPVITFLEERLDQKNLLIDPERYRFRKERYEKRIREMIRYASSGKYCRNQFLLGYFGQVRSPRCGRCDVCLADRDAGARAADFESVRKQIEGLLSEGGMNLDLLVDAVNQDADQVLPVIDHMLEEGLLVRGEDRLISMP